MILKFANIKEIVSVWIFGYHTLDLHTAVFSAAITNVIKRVVNLSSHCTWFIISWLKIGNVYITLFYTNDISINKMLGPRITIRLSYCYPSIYPRNKTDKYWNNNSSCGYWYDFLVRLYHSNNMHSRNWMHMESQQDIVFVDPLLKNRLQYQDSNWVEYIPHKEIKI